MPLAGTLLSPSPSRVLGPNGEGFSFRAGCRSRAVFSPSCRRTVLRVNVKMLITLPATFSSASSASRVWSRARGGRPGNCGHCGSCMAASDPGPAGHVRGNPSSMFPIRDVGHCGGFLTLGPLAPPLRHSNLTLPREMRCCYAELSPDVWRRRERPTRAGRVERTSVQTCATRRGHVDEDVGRNRDAQLRGRDIREHPRTSTSLGCLLARSNTASAGARARRVICTHSQPIRREGRRGGVAAGRCHAGENAPSLMDGAGPGWRPRTRTGNAAGAADQQRTPQRGVGGRGI